MHLDANSRGLGGDQGTFLLYSKVNGSSSANEQPTEPAVAADEEESIAPQTVKLIIYFHYSYDGA